MPRIGTGSTIPCNRVWPAAGCGQQSHPSPPPPTRAARPERQPGPEAIPGAIRSLTSKNGLARNGGVEALAKIGPAAVGEVTKVLKHPDRDARIAAANTL